ncbi:MAG: hypothetical protein AAFR79_15480, partial [Pseudomonadota bacterium]
MLRKLPIIVGLFLVVVVAVLSSIFIVDERQQALVLQFGEVVREVRGVPATPDEIAAADEARAAAEANPDAPAIEYASGPGLYFKIPLIQDPVLIVHHVLD